MERQEIEKKLVSSVERLPSFEERFSVYVQKFSCSYDIWPVFYCEVRPRNGKTLSQKLTVECVVYDKKNFILGMSDVTLYPDKFHEFEIISFHLPDTSYIDRIHHIQIYPKAY